MSPLTGTNKICAQCSKECKQWSQVKILKCPNFKCMPRKSDTRPSPMHCSAGNALAHATDTNSLK